MRPSRDYGDRGVHVRSVRRETVLDGWYRGAGQVFAGEYFEPFELDSE